MPSVNSSDNSISPSQEIPAQVRLGIEIRRRRMAQGLSRRQLVRLLGLRAHSNLVDYELGRRLPPADIVSACEKELRVAGGSLLLLHTTAMDERASEWSREAEEKLMVEGKRGSDS